MLREGSTPIRGVAFLGNDRLVTASDGVLHFWDLRERRHDRSHPHGRSIQVIKSSPDSRLFAAVDEASKNVLVCDAATCEVLYTFQSADHRRPVVFADEILR